MKLAIVTACPNGKISSVLSARLLDAAAQRQGWSTSVEIHDPRQPEKQLSPGDIEAADWVLVVNTGALDLARFAGKRLYQATPAQALQDADGFLRSAAALATEHTATSAAAPSPSAQPRLVAVTACPTGVAHTFMAAEAIQQAAKKLGYDLQVETQGSVGARNPLSAQAIADAVDSTSASSSALFSVASACLSATPVPQR